MTAELLQSLGHVLPGLLSMLGLICASAFFSASETALFYLSHDELRAFRSGRPRERIVAALMADPERLLTGILFWNLVINLSYFAVSVVVARRMIVIARGDDVLSLRPKPYFKDRRFKKYG